MTAECAKRGLVPGSRAAIEHYVSTRMPSLSKDDYTLLEGHHKLIAVVFKNDFRDWYNLEVALERAVPITVACSVNRLREGIDRAAFEATVALSPRNEALDATRDFRERVEYARPDPEEVFDRGDLNG